MTSLPARYFRKACVPVIICLLWLIALSGCSTLTHYPGEMKNLLADFEKGDFDGAYKKAEKRFSRKLDRLVYLLEGAMVCHAQGRVKESNALFEQAEELIRQYEEKAVISFSRGAGQIGSLVVNEKARPYEGEPFEKVLVNTFKAMNYLMQHKIEAARVEIRRSFARQQENRKANEKELERLERQAKNKKIQSQNAFEKADDLYRDQDEILGRVKNLYEDGFAYYLSAIVYELNNEYNDAYIDLKKADSLMPGLPFLENDLLRMARLSGLTDMLKTRQQELEKNPRFLNKQEEGEILLFFECGMAPRKQQITLSFILPDMGVVSLSLPKYQCVPNRIHQAALYSADGKEHGKTYLLTDIEAIAIRNLHDRMPALIIKQILRTAAKSAMAKAAKDKGGEIALFAATLYNIVTEQADLRSWLTLPQNIQAARIPLPAGRHDLVLALKDSTGRNLQKHSFSLELEASQKVFIQLRSGTEGLLTFNVYPEKKGEGHE